MKKTFSGFTLSRISAIVLVGWLATHFFVNHFGPPNASQHGMVMLRLSHPGWMAFYIIFLLAIIYHAAYGLWGIALEYLKREKILRAVRSGLLVLSAVLIITGIWILADTQSLLSNPPDKCFKCHKVEGTAGIIPSGRALRLF